MTFRNPLLPAESPDPFLMFHDGFYYLSVTRGEHISQRRATSLGELSSAPETVIWRDDHPARCEHMWAPEWFFLDGRWYLYYSASGPDAKGHRAYVLESQSADPSGPFHFKAQLQTDANDAFYAIDGSVLELPDGRRCFLWAGFPGHRLFLSEMENPWTLKGERVYLEASGFGCEEVREGPVCLRRGGKVFLVYSACDTAKPDYKLGMLFVDEDADVLDPANWQQHPTPVFERNDAAKVWGPGHHTFFQSPDKTQDWICYHAKELNEWGTDDRSTRAQRFGWNDAGFPDFGAPLSLETEVELPSGDAGR